MPLTHAGVQGDGDMAGMHAQLSTNCVPTVTFTLCPDSKVTAVV